MKYFSCQPDSHNAFGSLTNGVLTYFTVDCARYKRLSRASGGGVAERGERVPALIDTDTAAASAGSFVQSSSAASRSPAGAMPLLSEASHTPHFATDTRMHVQHTLTLPSSFQATHCCFSMANRTVFGTDMAFLGAANGLLALVVLREDLLLYVAGKDPHSLREAAAQREHRGGGGADASLAVHPGGAVGSISVKGVDEASAVGASSSSRHATGAPSTITWMRDKPLVLVGYTTGRVEWYRVSISPARQQELMNPEKEMPFGASVTSGAFAYQALNRDATTSRVARVVVGGHRDGMRTERVAACQLHDAGALVSSDYFPANGTVAVGSERGGLYLFHADQLEAPLCELRLTTPTAGFLYCHPFLPLVGVVSPVVWAEAGEAGRRRVGDTAGTVAAAASFAQKAEAAVGGSSRSGAVVGQAQRGGSSSPLRRGRRTPQEAALDTPFGVGSGGAEATARAGRHVGWHDESMQSGLTASAAARGASSSSLMTRETMRTGCVLTLVEYTTEAPPRQLARAWAGDEPLAPTHRLTQVLHHRINGAAPRYGTFYNFSWKFSSELELVIGNLEEGAVRVVRMTRRAAAAAAAGGGGGGAAGHLTSSSSFTHPRRGQADGEAATSVRGGNATVSAAAQRDDAAAAGCRHDAYAVVQEYNVRLSLHSLANVEYVSAATATLSVLAAPMVGSNNKNSSSGGGGASSSDGSAFQREVERHRRHSNLLAAAARAAADPRARLGFSAAAAASGLLCQPADAFWAGMAVVSLPRHRRDLSGPAAGERGYACCRGGLDGTPRRSFDGGVLDTFYGATVGCAGSEGRLRLGGEGGVVGAGPQLKENALAVAMLQPLRGDGATPGARRHRRHGADASSSSIYGATADGASSSWMQSTSSASTQQPRRRRRRDRDPLTPAVAVPSYAARSTRNEIANAVLIAADHRVDLHQRLRIGPGNVSCVVGMNAAGEVASVPIEVRAVATWHEEGSVFVGLGPTTCAADLVSIQGIERVMRRRHAAGFGVSAAANVAAAKKVGGYGSADVVLLFSYVATLEAVGVVATTGPVPSLMELLRRPATRGRRTVADVAQSHPHLAPRLRMAAQACVFHEDLRRLLALHVLGWLPPSLAEAWRLAAAAAESSSAAAAASADVAEWLQLPFEGTTLLSESSASADIERAAAVEVTHRRYREAASLLLRFAHRSPSYRAVATLLQRPSDALAMVDSSDPRVCAAFRASLTPWLLVIFHCLCSGVMVRQHNGSPGASSSLPATVLPCDLYQHPALLLWDRVALAVVMEDDASGALAYVLRDVVLPQCNPLQALLLAHGVHQRTSALMQAMVDCTGDFQLGACLFARVGVLTPAAALAFPFLLDGVVQGPQAASALAVAGGGRIGEEAGAVREEAETTAAAGLPGRLYEPTGNSRSCGGDPSEGVDGPTSWDPTRTTTGGASASPYAYLYNGDYSSSGSGSAGGGAHGSRRASPHTVAAASGVRQDGRDNTASHTARLVRNSALPPPPLPLSPLPASDASGRALPSSPHGSPIEGRPTAHRRGTAAAAAGAAIAGQQHSEGWAARYRGDSSNAVGGGRGTEGPDQRRNESSDVNNDDEDEEEETEDFSGEDGDLADAPWVWWAAAYRSFLDDEQAFVRRTTFDVECQQLRSSAVARAVAAAAAASSSASPAYGGGAAAAARFFSLSRRRSPSLRDLDAAGRRLLTSPERRLSLGAAHRAGGSSSGGGWSPHDAASSSPTPLSGSLSLPYGAPNVGYLPRGYGRTAGLSHAELVVGLHAVGGEAAIAAEGAGAQACVCGELHEGTQLIRSLLNLCSTTTTRCSVCLEPVRLGSCDVSSAFAWCTSCRHGGHAHHLQEWFRTHRRCPMNGCDCHCDEDSNLF